MESEPSCPFLANVRRKVKKLGSRLDSGSWNSAAFHTFCGKTQRMSKAQELQLKPSLVPSFGAFAT